MTTRFTLLCVLALAGCADDRASEAPLTSQLEAPIASASEQATRSTAALGIDAQPRDVQKRYYQALLMTKQQSVSTMQQVVSDLGTQEKKATSARSADSASLTKQRSDAQTQLDKTQQSVKALQAKLATF
jgi:hypothetical protein